MTSLDKNSSYQARYPLPCLTKAIKPYAKQIKGIHPECSAVPEISRRDFDTLVDSIKAQEVMPPIRIDENGLLVDGRCRLRACFVLELPLAKEHIVQSEFDAVAIADSNFARRHLTDDQKAMRGTRILEEERKKATKRKKAGGGKGRAMRAKSLGTDPVPSQTKRRRKPRALDIAAKKSGVFRERLALAEKIKKASPDLVEPVERGVLSIPDACESAGVTPSQKRKRVRQQSPPKSLASDHGSGPLPRVPYEDSYTNVIDRQDGIRLIESPDVVACFEVDSGAYAVAYRRSSKWIIRLSGDAKHRSATDKESAQKALVDWIQEWRSAERGSKPPR
ncbi:MAG: hypothetical protein ACF788_05120 [Novipirellula sp. JB048]